MGKEYEEIHTITYYRSAKRNKVDNFSKNDYMVIRKYMQNIPEATNSSMIYLVLSNNVKVHITKCQDEWFYARAGDNGRERYYLCDQIDGVKLLIDYLNI